MEADKKSNALIPGFNGELNIESIISAPLIAASKANVIMLSGQLQFLLEHCFDRSENTYSPKMITMEMRRHELQTDGTYSIDKLYFQVPLLCLLPINSIAIDNVKLNFDLEVTSVSSYKSSTPLFEKRAVINGKIAPAEQTNIGCNDYDKRSDTARMNVDINVGQLPLSKGVLSILDMYTKSITPVSSNNKNDNK